MLEVSDVVDRERKLGVPEVPYAHLQVTSAGVASDHFGAYPQAVVDGASGDRGLGAIV